MSDENTSPEEAIFSIPGMMCDGCAETVREALLTIPGVRQVKPSAWRKRVTVQFDASEVQPDQIRATLAEVGFAAA